MSKAVWFALGFAGAYVTLTGLLLWTTRRQEQPGWSKLARATHWMGYGLPLALTVAALAYFPARQLGADVNGVMMTGFLVTALLAAILAACAAHNDTTRRLLLGATGAGLIVLPLVRLAFDGIGWGNAYANGLYTVIAMDVSLVLGGALCLRSLRARAALPVGSAEPDDSDDDEEVIVATPRSAGQV
jgi:hypothetical protein